MIDSKKLDQQLKEVQKQLNPLVSICDIAKQSDELAAKVCDKSNFFYGRAVAVKDNFSIRNTKTTASSKMLDNYLAPITATVVARIKEKGGIIVAKTALDELAMGGTNESAYGGPVLNPFDPWRISGGSSGGSAVLVAKEIVDFALASDTGDSIRKPASFCGVVGVKPTYGLLSRYGVLPYACSLDHVGYFTKNVRMAAEALPPLVGRDDKDMTSLDVVSPDYAALLCSDIKTKKIAVLSNVLENVSNPAVKEEFVNLMKKLKAQGVDIREVTVDNKIMRAILPVYIIISNSEASANHSNLDGLRFGLQLGGQDTDAAMINSRTAGFSTSIKKRFVIGAYCLHQENQERLFRKAQKVRRLIYQEFMKLFAEYDAIVAPASGDVAPLLQREKADELSDSYLITENYMAYGNFMGLPSITVPFAKIMGLPLGLNITTGRLQEQAMFDIALAVEEQAGFQRWE